MTKEEKTILIHTEADRIANKMRNVRNAVIDNLPLTFSSAGTADYEKSLIDSAIKEVIEKEKLFSCLNIDAKEILDYVKKASYLSSIIQLINKKIRESKELDKKLINFLTCKKFGV